MREIKDVESSVSVVLELEIGTDTVYIRSNIRDFERDGSTLKKYDELQMTKDEYIKQLADALLTTNIRVGDAENMINMLMEL